MIGTSTSSPNETQSRPGRQHDPRREERQREPGEDARRDRDERPPPERAASPASTRCRRPPRRCRSRAGDRAVRREEDRARRDRDEAMVRPSANACAARRHDRSPGGRPTCRAAVTSGVSTLVAGRALQHPCQRGDHAARDLRMVVEQLVERSAAQTQQQPRFDGAVPRPSAAPARARRTRRRRRRARSRQRRSASGRGPCRSATTKSQSSTVPRSMIRSPGRTAPLRGARATATSVCPGTSRNSATRCSTATRSIVMSWFDVLMPDVGTRASPPPRNVRRLVPTSDGGLPWSASRHTASRCL